MSRILRIAAAYALIGVLSFTGCGQEETARDNTEEEAVEADTREQEIETAKGLDEYENRQITQVDNPSFSAEGIRRVEVISNEETLYSIEYIPEENRESFEYWRMKVPYEDTVIVNTETMLELYQLLESITFQPMEENVGNTGIQKSKSEIHMEFCQTEEQGNVSSKTYADSGCTLIIGNEDGEGNYYTALQSNPQQIMLMDKELIDQVVQTDPFSLILKVSAVVPITTVSELVITTEAESHKMNQEGDTYSYDGETLTQDEYQKLYQEFMSVLIEKEIPPDSKTEAGKSHLKLEFHRNVKNLQDVTVEYFEYDDTYDLLQVNGVEKFLVKSEDVENLIKAMKV